MSSHVSIETLAAQILSLTPPEGEDRRAIALVDQRLYMAQGPHGSIELFFEGEEVSFGTSVAGRSFEWSTYFDRNSTRRIPALVVRLVRTGANIRLMAHLAYESVQILERDASISNEMLVNELAPFMQMVASESILGLHAQMGLYGEMHFLFELLNFAIETTPTIDPMRAVSCWHGFDSSTRDFSNSGVAVEAKSTGRDARHHRIHPIEQLLPDDVPGGESVYVYSIGLRTDWSAGSTLLQKIDQVTERLDGHDIAKAEFNTRLSEYGGIGFHHECRAQYHLEPRFRCHLNPLILRVDDLGGLLRYDSFVDGSFPRRVLDVWYRGDFEGIAPINASDRDELFARLLA